MNYNCGVQGCALYMYMYDEYGSDLVLRQHHDVTAMTVSATRPPAIDMAIMITDLSPRS